MSNHNAINNKILFAKDLQTPFDKWHTFVSHELGRELNAFAVTKSFLYTVEKKDGVNRLVQRSIADPAKAKNIEFGEKYFHGGFYHYPSTKADSLLFSVESFATPESIFEVLPSGETILKKQEFVGKGYKKSDYVVKRHYARAADGVAVPVTLVHHKNTAFGEKPVPLLLSGYGSYGYTVEPYFSVSRLNLLNRGIVFAHAHVRGSSMFGRQWYEAGKYLNKRNTFTDFIAVSQYLVDNEWTSSNQLAITGTSAGGLLIGAVLNMRPDLYKVAIAKVPFVDVVTTMLDESIPLTTFEFQEWGNPKDKKYHDYMLSYSPYDNVKRQAYPSLLVTTGYHDSQVQYWEPAKWVAKLRAERTNKEPLLFLTDMDSGHGGKSGRYSLLKQEMRNQAFLLNALEIEK